jgi:hypothetical protein
MGVLTRPSSAFMKATAGEMRPAEGSPADGRPAKLSRHGAEWGVRAEAADLMASAGTGALTGVVSARVGLTEGISTMSRVESWRSCSGTHARGSSVGFFFSFAIWRQEEALVWRERQGGWSSQANDSGLSLCLLPTQA